MRLGPEGNKAESSHAKIDMARLQGLVSKRRLRDRQPDSVTSRDLA
jgi:hypothetical protein